MCDTMIALGNSTQDGSIIFGKNSDRDPSEVHSILYIPRSIPKKNATITCQYLDISEFSDELYAVILAKPQWLKIGCEMGANEYGVVMGNEAIFTKEPYEREAPLGMDLMTITLQRSKSAYEGLTLITKLLEKYGQGGVASQIDPNFIYHNSFIIADLKEAWILETAGRFWAAKKVQDVASISNGLTIQDAWDLASPGLIENAVENGWCESKNEFNFADSYSDPGTRVLSGCLARQSKMINGLLDNKGKISTTIVMELLKSHDSDSFRPDKGTMASVCGHYNSQTIHQTTGSMVAHLLEDFQVYWLTGTSAPCISVFKPFFFSASKPIELMKTPALTNDDQSLWWKHEKLHRLALLDYPTRAPMIIKKNMELQKRLLQEVTDIIQTKITITEPNLKQILNQISTGALDHNFTLIEELIKLIKNLEINQSPRKAYQQFWTKQNEKDGLELN